MTKAILHTPDGSRLELYLNGAHITSWIPQGHTDMFFLSEASAFQESAIRGGVPIIFPQFGGRAVEEKKYPQMISHGFARHSEWKIISTGAKNSEVHITLQLSPSAFSEKMWPEVEFQTILSITLSDSLSMELQVENTGDKALKFTGGFHPYFATQNLSQVTIHGLEELQYEDAYDGFAIKKEGSEPFRWREPINRVYLKPPKHFEIHDGERTILVEQEGFPETVLWTPTAQYVEEKDDMAPGDDQKFICLEPASATLPPIEILSGATWRGTIRISSQAESRQHQ